MRNIRIYLDKPLELNASIELDRQSAHHLTRVLRLRNDDLFTIFNGYNGEYTARLKIDNKKHSATIIKHIDNNPQAAISITLLQCISKGERMDIAIQKATELNVSTIIPVISEHTVVSLKGDRWEKKLKHWRSVIISACEQCGRNDLAEIRDPVNMDQLLASEMSGSKLVLDPLSEISLSTITSEIKNVYLLIGPEGGLSENELIKARESGFTGIKLGHRVLRTETAAIAGISAIQTLWGDFR